MKPRPESVRAVKIRAGLGLTEAHRNQKDRGLGLSGRNTEVKRFPMIRTNEEG